MHACTQSIVKSYCSSRSDDKQGQTALEGVASLLTDSLASVENGGDDVSRSLHRALFLLRGIVEGADCEQVGKGKKKATASLPHPCVDAILDADRLVCTQIKAITGSDAHEWHDKEGSLHLYIECYAWVLECHRAGLLAGASLRAPKSTTQVTGFCARLMAASTSDEQSMMVQSSLVLLLSVAKSADRQQQPSQSTPSLYFKLLALVYYLLAKYEHSDSLKQKVCITAEMSISFTNDHILIYTY